MADVTPRIRVHAACSTLGRTHSVHESEAHNIGTSIDRAVQLHSHQLQLFESCKQGTHSLNTVPATTYCTASSIVSDLATLRVSQSCSLTRDFGMSLKRGGIHWVGC